jgi:hypothetical protein
MSKRVYLLVAVILVCSVLFPALASASPSYLGPSGLIWIPDDQTTALNSFAFSAHFMDLKNRFGGLGLHDNTSAFAADYSPFVGLEVGYTNFGTKGSNRSNFVNGKFRIVEQNYKQPISVTAGVIDVLDDTSISGYAIVSHRFLIRQGSKGRNQPSLSLSAGYGGGLFENGFIAGGELHLTPQFSLIADTTQDRHNVGARFTSMNLSLDFGLMDMRGLAGGVSYSIKF